MTTTATETATAMATWLEGHAKVTNAKLEYRTDGWALKVDFRNGYGASVIINPCSYGGDEGLYELAVLRGDKICYDSPITEDVLGWLTPADVCCYLNEIARLTPMA